MSGDLSELVESIEVADDEWAATVTVGEFGTRSQWITYLARAVLPIVQQAQREAVEAALGEVVPLLDELADPNPCWFDHHGGCQEHGFLDLTPGDVCPNEAAQRLIRAARERAGAS